LRTEAKTIFSSKSKALTLQDFEALMEEAGILDILGLQTKKIHKLDSERLIMILNKSSFA
jgi:hypothetical protein